MRRPTRRPKASTLGALGLVVALLVTLMSGAAGPSAAATRLRGGTVSFAEPPGSPLNEIFPFNPATTTSVNDVTQLQALLWRPLNWFGTGESVARLDRSRTLYRSVTYSEHATVVTIKLKGYRWSDGYPLTSRDVEFAFNLYRYDKAEWADYVPGEFPDNVASIRLPDAHTVVLRLTHPVNETWFTDDQLSLITPMPQHAWDRVSALGPVGNADQTPAGAAAVFDFLDTQAMDVATYATNPLWQVVDGPWTLRAFSPDGAASFVPNPRYSGPIKPTISEFDEVPFSTTADEVRALRSGAVDVGYLPITESGAVGAIEAAGYGLAPWDDLAIAYGLYDFGNPAVGRLLSERYIRQAIQRTVDQPAILQRAYGGYGSVTAGPVPLLPKSSLISAVERSQPDRYDVSSAVSLLRAHGWRVRSSGTDVCERPGSGPGRCGRGVARGTPLSFTLLYPTGSAAMTEEADAIRSGAARAGISMVLVARSFIDLVSTVGRCPAACSWQIALFGVTTDEQPYPTGESMFLPSSPLNMGGYADPTVSAAVEATLRSNEPGVLSAYEDAVTASLPWLWLPTPVDQLTMIRTGLRGVAPQNADLFITPEDYYFVR